MSFKIYRECSGCGHKGVVQNAVEKSLYDEQKAKVKALEDDNYWLMQQISMCRSRMTEAQIDSVCKLWSEFKEAGKDES